MALEVIADPGAITDQSDPGVVKSSLKRGVIWLLSQRETLMKYDRRAPNRLLFDASAFQACGTLVNNKQVLQAASEFVQSAIHLLSPEGYFLEGGGWDTSYQAVSHSGVTLRSPNSMTIITPDKPFGPGRA